VFGVSQAMKRQRRKRQGGVPGEALVPDLKLVAQLAVRVPGDLALRLRKFCQESGRSFNQTVAEALEQYLAQKKR
jgi:predicted HicB family RNase H-like nuclease